MPNVIVVAEQFSRFPAGRVKDDGPFSGQRFREEFLEPVLRNNERAEVVLDGTRGYGSSFLEEAFGGLVRAGFTPERIRESFEITTEDESLVLEISDYIAHALDGTEKNSTRN